MLSTRLSLENQKVIRSFVDDGLMLYLPMNGPNINTGLRLLGTGSTSFDGVNDYVSVADDSTLDITGDFTITMWAKFDTFPSSSAGEAILQKGDQSSNRAYGLSIYNTGGNTNTQMLLSTNGSGWFNTLKGSTNLSVATWYHISATYDGTTVKLYLDGVLDGSEAETDDIETNSSALVLGYNGSAGFMGGSLKNVAIWNRALTATEVQNVMYKTYAEVSGRLLSGMVSWWKLEESVVALATKAADSHGSNTGTITGATVAASGSGSKYGGVVPTLPRMIDNSPKVQADSIGAGSALFVTGNVDYIETGRSSADLKSSGTFSVSCWLKANSYKDWVIPIGDNDDNQTDNGWALFTDNTAGTGRKIGFWVSHYNDRAEAVAGQVGEWYHVAGTYDGTTQRLYINGVLSDSEDDAWDNAPTKTILIGSGRGVGEVPTTGHAWDGNISQVGLWNAVLTQAQIQSIMEKTYEELTASEKTNLVSYWALDEADGNGVVDKVDETLSAEKFTAFANASSNSFDTFSASSTGFTAGADVSGAGAIVTNQLWTAEGGNIAKITFDIVINSGVDAKLYWASGTTGGAGVGAKIGNYGTGSHIVYANVGDGSDDGDYLEFYKSNGDASNITVSNFSVKIYGGNAGILI